MKKKYKLMCQSEILKCKTLNILQLNPNQFGKSLEPYSCWNSKNRVAYPKLEHPTPRDREFAAMLRNSNHHSQGEKIKSNSQFTTFEKLSSLCKNYDFNFSELLTGCPNLGHTTSTLRFLTT